MIAIDKLKNILVAPREQLQPLLRFRGNKDLNRMHAKWSFVHGMMFSGCESLCEGTALYRETEIPHFCGMHAKQWDRMALFSFMSRLAHSPKVTTLTKGLTEYVRYLVPEPWDLQVIGVGINTSSINKRVMKQLKANGKSEDIRYLFNPSSADHQMMMRIHEAVPRGVNVAIRNDLCQDMLCAVIAGDLKLENVPNAIGRYMREAQKFSPHTETDYVGFTKTHTGLGANTWKDQYVAERSFEDKIEDLQEHWECGETPERRPIDSVMPKARLTAKANKHADYVKLALRKRKKEIWNIAC